MRLSLIAIMVAGLSVGCATVDPYTGEQKTSNAAKGAATGAVVGALLGAVINHDDREKGALIGAGLGAGAGGGWGYYMDQQEAALREKLAGTGVGVARDGDTINLVMPGNITFATNQHNIKSSFFDVLNSVTIVLAEYDKTNIHVAGFTDSTGSFEYNQGLSEKRASSVASYLRQQGVDFSRVSTTGYGPRNPIADNGTVAGRAQNRRVELKLVPISS